MKKVVIFILLVFSLVLPIGIKALTIETAEIQGSNEVIIGNEFYLSFYIGVSDIQKGSYDSLGIIGIVYELDFDDSVFSIIEAKKIDSFETVVYKSDNKYYVLSYVDETNIYKNKCADEVLYCTDYLQSVKFYVKDTTVDKTEVKINDINVMLLPVGSDYENADMTIINGSSSSHTINIKKNQETVDTPEPDSIVSNSSSKDITSDVKSNVNNIKAKSSSNNKNEVTPKDTNNYLSSIEITDYKIDFDKDKLEYSLEVDENINELNITAIPESKTSKVDIKGANDLKSNNYVVIIDVKSEDDKVRTYTIKVNQKKDENIEATTEKIDKTDKTKNSKFKITKKSKNIIVISSIVLVVIFLILGIVSHKKNKALDKQFDEML